MKPTVIELPDLRLITCKWASFPDGNREAFERLERQLDSLSGRHFYALVYETGGIEYYAGLIPHDRQEEIRFAKSGYRVKEVKGGLYARVKLFDWQSKVDQIKGIMRSLIETFGIDSGRPQIEYYRRHDELHLLAPVPPQ